MAAKNSPMNVDQFRSWLRNLRGRVATLRSNSEHRFADTPLSIDRGDGQATDAAAEGVALLALIVLMVISGIVLIFTTGLLFWVVFGLAVLAGLYWLWLMFRLREPMLAWQRECDVFAGALVMANSALFEAGKVDMPGLMAVFVGAVDQADHERLAACAERVYALQERSPQQLSGEEAAIADWIGKERARYDRIKVPAALAGDDSTWLVGMRLSRRAMRHGKLDQKIWPVLARHGKNESAELLPYSVMD